jgi:thymidylate synthase
MQQLIGLMKHVLANGRQRGDRTGTGTLSVFGTRMEFDLAEGLPLDTTRRIFWRGIVEETLWFMRGSTDARELQEKGVKIWDEWAATKAMVETADNIDITRVRLVANITVPPDFDDWTWESITEWFGKAQLDVNDFLYVTEGEIGPLYGKQARAWPTEFGSIDQVKDVLASLRENPTDRRMCISHWNVEELPLRNHTIEENIMEGRMSLAPCHAFYQFYAEEMTTWERLRHVGRHYHTQYVEAHDVMFREQLAEANVPTHILSCQLYQRSTDVCCGLPFNIASYSLVTMMFAHILNMVPGKFIHISGDTHIYNNHVANAKIQVERESRKLPTLKIDTRGRDVTDPAMFTAEDFILEGYFPDEPLEYKVSK